MNTKISTFFLCLGLLFFSGSCGDPKSLKPLEQERLPVYPVYGETNVDFCTIDPSLVKQYVKVIFVLDISGSNGRDHNLPSGQQRPATDPTRTNRYDSLIDWLSTRDEDENEFYTLIEFSGNSAQIPNTIANNDFAPFMREKTDFQNVVQNQKGGSVDNGGTPYKTALETVIQTITQDAQKAKDDFDLNGGEAIKSTYVVAFLSDGQPTDEGEPYTGIIQLIKNDLMKLKFDNDYGAFIDNITLHTGYYYNQIDWQPARELLADMANAGDGDSYSFDTSSGGIDFDALTRVFLKKVTTSLTDIIVTNRNTLWDTEYQMLLADSDGDGMSDTRETLLGSNPLIGDSDQNGVRDSFEAFLGREGVPCKDVACDPDNAFEFKGCFDANSGDLIDTDRDGIGDCEERELGTNPKLSDSNGDDLPDPLCFRYGLPCAVQDDESNPSPPAGTIDTDFDGVNNLLEVKQNTHPQIPNDQLPGLLPYQYKLTQTGINPINEVVCYNLKVTDMPLRALDDEIEIYIREIEKNQTGRKLMRIGRKKMEGGKASFSVDEIKALPILK